MKKLIYNLVSMLILSAMVFVNFPSCAFADLNIEANVLPINGQKVTITGISQGTNPKNISIKVMSPSGSINYLDQTSTDANGNFVFSYSMKDTDAQGRYDVYILGQKVTAFNYSGSVTPVPTPSPTPSPTTSPIVINSNVTAIKITQSSLSPQQVNIDGSVSGTNPQQVTIEVRNPAGGYSYVDQKSSDSNGSFSFTFMLNSTDIAGDYYVYILGNKQGSFHYNGKPSPSPVPTSVPTPVPTPVPSPSPVISQIDGLFNGSNQTGSDILQKAEAILNNAGTVSVSQNQVVNGVAKLDEASLENLLSNIDAAFNHAEDKFKAANMQSLGAGLTKSVTIDCQGSGSLGASIPKTFIDKARDIVDSINVITKDAQISINKNSIAQSDLAGASNVTVQVTRLTNDQLSKNKNIDPVYKKLIEDGGYPVLDMQIKADDKLIHNFSQDNPLVITMPYTLAPGQSPSNISVFYIDDAGKIQMIPASNVKYDSDKKQIVFTTTHFSKYVAMPKALQDSFTDISAYSWAEEAIHSMFTAGIINGKTASTFAPADKVTRAEFVKMLCLTLGIKPAASGKSTFTDVKTNKWYAPYIAAAQASGIIQGTGSNAFLPEKTITRQDICVMVINALKKMKSGTPAPSIYDINGFGDKSLISDYALKDVAVMVKMKLMQGISKQKFGPKDATTRAQAAVIIYRMLNLISK